MAICTMLVVIPFWCTREPEHEEDVRDNELVVEAQPAPEVAAEPLVPSGGLRELQVREPASARQAAEAPRLMGPDVVEPDEVSIQGDIQGAPDPRLYGQGAGTTWTPTATYVPSTPAPSDPAPDVRLRSTPAPASAPVPEPMDEEFAVARARPAPAARPIPQPVPQPQPYAEPVPPYEPDGTTEMAALPSRAESVLPSVTEVQRFSSAPATRAPATRPVPVRAAIRPNGQLNLASLLASGELTSTAPEPFAESSDNHEAQGIAQRKDRRFRRAIRETERAARRLRRQGG